MNWARFAWYYGKMFSRHFYSFGGFGVNTYPPCTRSSIDFKLSAGIPSNAWCISQFASQSHNVRNTYNSNTNDRWPGLWRLRANSSERCPLSTSHPLFFCPVKKREFSFSYINSTERRLELNCLNYAQNITMRINTALIAFFKYVHRRTRNRHAWLVSNRWTRLIHNRLPCIY